MHALLHAVPPSLQQATANPRLHWRLLDTHRQVWVSLLWGHCSFLLGPGTHQVLFVLSKNLFPQSCVGSVIKSHFKVKLPGGSQSLCQIPRLGNLLWALELLQQCENFFDITVFQFVGCLLSGSMVGLTCYPSQVCFSQSSCPRSRPLLTCSSAGDTQTLKGRSGSVSCGVPGSWCTQGFV